MTPLFCITEKAAGMLQFF